MESACSSTFTSQPNKVRRQFPNSDVALPDSYGKLLFRMSSVLPPHVSKLAVDKGYKLIEGAKGFMFNADPKDIANFFDIGTRPRLATER